MTLWLCFLQYMTYNWKMTNNINIIMKSDQIYIKISQFTTLTKSNNSKIVSHV